MPRSAHATAARMVRGSVPSGRTTSASAARACSTSWYRNAAGLNRRGRDVLVSDPSQDGSSASAMVSVTPSIRSRSSAGRPGSRSRTRVAVW